METILVTTSTFGAYDLSPLGRLKEGGFQVVLNPYGRRLTEEEIHSLMEIHKPVGMIAGVEPLTARVLECAPGLKVISRCGVGLDSVDLAAAADRGIIVTNTPDAPVLPVAELTLGLMLCLLRNIHRGDADMRNGRWHRPMGGLLFGKTVGIIGCGKIGSCVAGLLSLFRCRVLGCDLQVPSAKAPKYTPVDLHRLLSESDIVTLHIPYSDETHYLINEERLTLMKPGAFLINAARGGIIDETALHDALSSGHIAGAALDTFEKEPYTGPLTGLDNVLLTPHIGSYAAEGRVMMENESADRLLWLLGGKSKAGVSNAPPAARE